MRVPPTRDTKLGCLRTTVRPEEGLPVLRDAEDGVGAGEGGAQGGGVVEVGGDDVGTEGREGERRGGGGVAGEGADGVARVKEEAAGDGAALVSGGADDDEEFLLGGFSHGVGWGRGMVKLGVGERRTGGWKGRWADQPLIRVLGWRGSRWR